MAFGVLEDLKGPFDLVVFSEPFAQYGSLLRGAIDGDGESGPIPLVVTGTLEADDTPKILVRQVFELDRAEEKLASRLHVTILADEATPDRLRALRDLLLKSRGECSVVVGVVIPGESETLLSLGDVSGVRANAALLAEIDGLFGKRVTELTI
jgi:hypothetical protein